MNVFNCGALSPPLSLSITITTSPISLDLYVPLLSHLVCSHLALWALARLQALVERPLDGLHLSGDGLEGLLIMLLPLQSLIQTFLFLTDLL